MDYAEQLAMKLQAIEAAAAAYDGGEVAAAQTIAESLTAVFGASPPLLSHLGATYVKLVSSVPKPPYPQGKFAPLTDVSIDLSQSSGAMTGQAAGFPSPNFRPRLGSTRDARTVQAPDWWRAEPVFLVGHSKATRRDVARAASGATDGGAAHLAELLARAGWTGAKLSAFGESARVVPVRAAAAAAVRQVAHEVLHSPELLKLAGRATKV
jgi:hypothetical protein